VADIKSEFEIFLACAPGLEEVLREEAVACGFKGARAEAGGVTILGSWPEVWRANLELRGTTRVLARIGSFRAVHLSQLDKRATAFPWQDFLHGNVPVRVEATCRKSRIYHSGAAAQRITAAIRQALGEIVADDAALTIMARIEKDVCTLSIDTSGESLHKRGFKEAMAKAPMRETLAAMFLRSCGYSGDEPLLDPMCGSGTFVIEAAEIALGLKPGRDRAFAFEQLKSFDAATWNAMKSQGQGHSTAVQVYGYDRDAGAITSSESNAVRAGVSAITTFRKQSISALQRPEGTPGLVIVNPPYGARIGDKKPLLALHAKLGQKLKSDFSGWRVGLVTTDKQLAYATGLPFKPTQAPVNHGGLRVTLFQTDKLN
jgi:putative N6-adenine-specific DNA methylase